ncbi:MAG: TrmH family RNA methyltransferase [Thermomicrobiales bacterium]
MTSVHNPTIVATRSLHRRKNRREQGAFLIEGVRLIRDALTARAAIRKIILCPEFLGERESGLRADISAVLDASQILTVAPAVMRSLTETETPQGAMAVADLPDAPLPIFNARDGFVLVLDGVRDPGNVGTLLRAAAAAGCDAAVTISGTADAFAPKVVRSAMGAHFRLPIYADIEWTAIRLALAPLPKVYGADGASPMMYDAVDWTRGCAVIIGNEDRGLSAEAHASSHGTVGIPMARGVESLNAAVSGAIILFEVVRQRRSGA